MDGQIVKPKLKAAKKPHWGIRLDEFRKRYGLSHRDLADVVICIRKSAVFELCNGKCNPRMEAVIKPVIASNLRIFLKEKQAKHDLEIEREMLDLFYEPDCKEETPVLTERRTLSREAQIHFKLSSDPFPNEPPRSRKEAFTTPQLDKIATKLDDAIRYQGFLAIIGDRGSGKSFMRRRVDDSCEKSAGKMRLLYPDFPNMERVHAGAICSFILREFGRKVPLELLERYRQLKKMLGELSRDGVRVALGFDECHRLDPRLLTALKNFWEMGSGGYDRWLGLILFGQPAFKTTLLGSDFWEITERLKIIEMPDMSKNAWDYISHRLKLVGGDAEKLFDREAVTRLARIASTPLALGNLANSALLQAKRLNEHKVNRGILEAAGLLESSEPRLRAARTNSR